MTRTIHARTVCGLLLLLGTMGMGPAIAFAAEKNLLHEEFATASANPGTHTIAGAATWCVFHNRAGKMPEVKSGENGNCVEFAAQSQVSLLTATFPATRLQRAGDSIHLSVTYRYLHGPTNPAPGFVAGLYNSNGMPLEAGSGDTPFQKELRVGMDFTGWRVGKNPNAASQDLIVDMAGAVSSRFPEKTLSTTDTGAILKARQSHQLHLRISRQEDGSLTLESALDERPFHSVKSATSADAHTFDTVMLRPLSPGFGESTGNNYVQVLKVSIVSSAE